MERFRNISQQVAEINVFDTETNDEHVKRNEILSTRIYIFIIIIILSLFTLYTSFQSQSIVITLPTPTLKQYENLQLKYSNDIHCPCKDISVSYGQFLNIKPEYNQICSSDFISQKWIDYLFYENTSYYFQLDFRHSASARFQILRTLCEQTQKTVDDNLEQFYSLQFITNALVSPTIFDTQARSFIELFQQTTPALFQNLLKTIRQTITGNVLFSATDIRSAYEFSEANSLDFFMNNIYYYEAALNGKYFDCYCDQYAMCQLPEGIYSNMNVYDFAGSNWVNNVDVNASTAGINATFLIPGMIAACMSMEAVMYSTSECLFDQTCLNQIGSYINYSSISIDAFSVLNQSYSTRYITMETLANNLFIEQWMINKSYEKYFDQCQPTLCQYTDYQKNSFIHILAAVISLYGGLQVVLMFIIPVIVTFIRKRKKQQHRDININVPNISKRTRLLVLLRSVKATIINVNIFDKHSADEHKKRNAILSTKIYFVILIISVIVFAGYISREKQLKTISVYNPTRRQFEQLKNESLNNLQCPCTEISIKYEKFINFDPTYHEVCSSVFVSHLWYNAYAIWSLPCSGADYPHYASYYASLLSTYCEAATEIISNSLTQFFAMEYITSETVIEKQFTGEVNSFIESYKSQIQQSFKEQLNLIRTVTFSNKIFSALRTNADYSTTTVKKVVQINSYFMTNSGCSCATRSTCRIAVALCNGTDNLAYLPSIYQSCYMVDSLLMSTTECFYSATCVNILKSNVNQYSPLYNQLETLNNFETSQYQTNETIKTIVDSLFIEKWNENYSYDNYYNQCRPSVCSYTIEQPANLIYILTKLIGVYGGLTIVIRFLVPQIINIIRQRKRQHSVNSISTRMNLYFQLIATKLLHLNLFRNQTINQEKIRKQILASQLYIISFIISLFIFVLYTSLNKTVISVNIALLNLTQYQQLEINYKNTLVCPCNEISIDYEQFIELQPFYHEVCSSTFVAQLWYNYLYNRNNLDDRTFRTSATSQFQALGSLCELTQESINNSLTQFYSTKLISGQLISNESFQNQVNSIVSLFQTSTPKTFKRTLDMIRGMIQGNFFLSVIQTNWKFTILQRKKLSPFYTNPITYNNSCTCGTSAKCSEPVALNGPKLDGFFIGCYPLEAMLQSSLQCLYNQTCLDLTFTYFGRRAQTGAFHILSSTNQYGIEEKVEQMVDRLFVDQWVVNRSYENYFQQCNPTSCTYSYIESFNIFYIITTVLGLSAGLTITLRLIIPFIIHIIFRLLCKRKQQVVPSPLTLDSVIYTTDT